MKKYTMIIALFLAGTSFSTIGNAQEGTAAPGQEDVGVLIEQMNKKYDRIQSTYRKLKFAHDTYVDNPTDDNYAVLTKAANDDAAAAQDYNKTVIADETLIKEAEKVYYGETPATKAEIQTSPPVLQGESVEKRMKETEQQIVEDITKTMQSSPNQSSFAQALDAQRKNLQDVQKRVAAEGNKISVPAAKKQDSSLADVLGRAIDARMEIVFCANNSEKKCCAQYPKNPRCSEEDLGAKGNSPEVGKGVPTPEKK